MTAPGRSVSVTRRGAITRQTMGTATVVALVTVLVWIFAEAESLLSRKMTVPIAFGGGATGSYSVDVAERGWSGRVDLFIEGSPEAVQQAESVFGRAPIALSPGMEGFPTEPGEHTLDLREVLRNAPEIADRAVTVAQVVPPAVRVRVSTLVTREIRLGFDADGQELESPAQIIPPAAKLTMSAAAAASWPPERTLRVRPSPDIIGKLVPGRPEAIANAPIELPADIPGAVVDPPRAEVRLTLRSKLATLVLPSVPVYVSLPAAEVGRWDVLIPEEDRFLTDVEVSGPGDVVDQVRRGQVRVAAHVVLTFDDLERGVGSKEVTFGDLPTALVFKADATKVRLKIVRRERESPS